MDKLNADYLLEEHIENGDGMKVTAWLVVALIVGSLIGFAIA